MKPLSLDTFTAKIKEGALVLDLRDPGRQREGFAKGSLLLDLALLTDQLNALTQYVKLSVPVLLITDPEVSQSLQDLFRDAGVAVAGYLEGGFASWQAAEKERDLLIEVLPDELMMDLPFDENLVLLDLRPAVAFADSHLKEAVNIPLSQIADPLRMAAIEDKDNLYLIGDSDAATYFAASVLKRNEIHNLRVVTGGWEQLREQPQATLVKDPGMLN